MPSPWNDTADRQLLLTIIHILSPSPPNWADVAAAMGPGFTAESTRQHYAKMRKACEEKMGPTGGVANGNGGGDANPAGKKPGRKPRQPKTGGTTQAGVKRKATAAMLDDDIDDAVNKQARADSRGPTTAAQDVKPERCGSDEDDWAF